MQVTISGLLSHRQRFMFNRMAYGDGEVLRRVELHGYFLVFVHDFIDAEIITRVRRPVFSKAPCRD